MERGGQRSVFEFQNFVGGALDVLGDAVAMGGPRSSLVRSTVNGQRAAGRGSAHLPCATMCYMARNATRSTAVGVRELRQNLSIYLDRVKKGEALTVTEHGAAVAILRPLAPDSNVLARLVAEGRAMPPARSMRQLPRPLTLKLEKPLAEILDDLRDERV